MSHYAKIENGFVTQVIVAEQDFVDTQVGTWVQTSYNTKKGKHYTDGVESVDQTKALRKNYATVGGIYDATRDAFYLPQPYPSWTLNETTCLWEAPVTKPTDGARYEWNEETQTWDSV